jgi:hypothetical protein
MVWFSWIPAIAWFSPHHSSGFGFPSSQQCLGFTLIPTVTCISMFWLMELILCSWCLRFQKLHGYKLDDTFQDSGGIRRWLELQITFTELGIIITEALPNEVKNLKVNTNSSKRDFLSLQEEETKRLSNDIVSVVSIFCLLVTIQFDILILTNKHF